MFNSLENLDSARFIPITALTLKEFDRKAAAIP